MLNCALRIACALALLQPEASAEGYSEYEVKAAFLFKFTKFVEWPPAEETAGRRQQEETPFRIGVLGKDPFDDILDETVKDQQVQGRKIEIVRGDSLQEMGYCEILYVARDQEDAVAEVLTGLKGKKTLTVSDMEGFTEKGGMICLEQQDARIQFSINQEAANEANLKISAQLLHLAREVKRARSQNDERREGPGTAGQ